MAEPSDTSPTRSVVIELKDERRAMHEGYVFLDEKCLLLAAEILRELELHARLQRNLLALHERASAALRTAVLRHGLQGLQVYPAADLDAAQLRMHAHALMGVRLQEAELDTAAATPAAESVERSPEAQACRDAFAALLSAAASVAAVAGNLERLSLEYRRSVRRARALQDVMLPELDATIGDIESRLEELERDEAIFGRVRPGGG